MRRILARLMGANPHECEEVRAAFSDYLDDELAVPDAQRLETHVGVCPRCRQALANLRVTLRSLGRLTPDDHEDETAAERVREAWRAFAD